MSLTILYRNPKRPDEAGTTMIAGQADAEKVIKQLEQRGFVVDKVSFAPSARATPAATADGSPASRR